ncbi:MAG: MBG domain-containing protein [Rudaea sp.]
MQLFISQRRGSAGVLLVIFGILFGFALSGAAWADSFVTTPTRLIGPSNNATVGASINGQGGWTVSEAKYDEEISNAHAHSGRHAWHVSNWYHQGTVNPVLTPAFPSVKEGASGSRNHVDIEYWFYVPSVNAGLLVSSSLTDTPGQRLTYAAVRDDAGVLTVQAVGISQGIGWTNTDAPPFDDPGIHYDIQSSGTLAHDTWYRLHVAVDLNVGAQNDQVTYTVYNADGTVAWASGAMPSWEDAYLNGQFGAPAGTVVTADHVGFRIVENPDHLNNRNPYGYATNRPAGLFVDDLSIQPNLGTGIATGFENDRYVSTSGSDIGNCATATPANARCKTITYALTQAGPDNTIHVASGNYDEAGLTISQAGLQLVGDNPGNKPKITRVSGGINQALLVINGVKNVHVENLEFDMDQTFVAEGIIANGFVDGLSISGDDFVTSQSVSGTSSKYSWRNAISINDDNGNSQSVGLGTGSNVSITQNTISGAGGVGLRCGVDMDNGVGTISGNDITALVHDIRVRFSTVVTGNSSGNTTTIYGNTTHGRGLEFDSPNAGAGAITISNNHINAIAGINGSTNYAADFSLVRLIDNQQNIATTLSGNTFAGHIGSYRGVLIENYPGVQLTGNTFTPASGATDFVSLVISNKELNSGTAIAPYPMSITAEGNTFNSSGVAGAGRAVEFLNDNDAGGTATFGSLIFGGAGSGETNSFDGNLRWYFHLDDYKCETVTASGSIQVCSTPPLPNYADDIGSNPATNTDVRPFTGNVSAANNLFDGQAPSSATANSLLAHTYDKSANSALGTVDYGLTATQSVVYVDATFSGNYGNSESFPFTNPTGACGPTTAYDGINAFATIADGLMHVVDGGTVCVAKGNYAESLTLGKSVQLIGDGKGPTDTVLSQGITVAASGVDSTNPLVIANLRVTDPVSGHSGIAVKAESHLAFRGVALVGNGGSGINLSQDAQDITIADSLLDGNTSGLRTASATHVADVAITNTTFSNNSSVGLILFGASNGTGSATNWSIDQSQFLSNDNTDTTAFGGGIWIDTFGQTVDGFHVTNSSFADNGSDSAIQFKRGGINVLAISGVMKNVSLCTNTFTENAGTSGTQKNGIVVYDGTNNTGYQPITVCADNTFNGTDHSISGISQYQFNGTQPVVDITGGAIANTEYINGLVQRIHASVQNGLFPTISAAMNDSATVDGDEIHAPAGVYAENVSITHNDMTLSGDGNATIIDGSNSTTPGITLPNGSTGATIENLAVQNVHNSCIYGSLSNSHTTITGTLLTNCRADLGGANGGGIYMNGPVDSVNINNNEVTASAARGIVIWNGIKTHISITNNNVHDLAGCCGIELQDGTASGVTVTGNTVKNTGDSGLAFIGLTSGAGPNLIDGNTITNTGRFGMEIKLPNGTGATSGDGSIVVSNNIVTRPASPTSTDQRDVAGISVIRRSYCSTCGETDVTTGVVVTANAVTGWTPLSGSPNDGFGIVAEGTNSHVYGNAVSGNEIGIQLQAGNGGYPGDSDQSATNDFFSRGNTPLSCLDLGTNTFSGNTTDNRSVSNPPGTILTAGVHNTTRGTNFCSIQAAINDAATQSNDTIVVDAGTYPENVVLNKSVILKGPFNGTPGSDGSRTGSGEAVIQPASGFSLTFAAQDAVVNGLTIKGSSAGGSSAITLSGANANNLTLTDNRIIDVTNGAGITSEPGADCAADGFDINHNLFSNITGSGATNGRGIRLGNGHCHVQIVNNDFDTMAYAINANGGNGTVQDLTITDNRVQNTTGTAFVITKTTRTLLARNTVTAAPGGLFISDGMTDFTASCNSLSASGNGISTAAFFGNAPNSGVHIFDNAISGGSADVNNGMPQTLTVGSNWYGGGNATVTGSNALVADALAANPIGDSNCGDNTPTQIVVVSGSNQHALITSAFGNSLIGRVQDALGGAVVGEPVQFTAPASGASASLASASGNTNYNGVFSTTAIANAVAGSYPVTLADTNVTGIAPATFTLYNERAAATITLNASDLNATYDGNPHAVGATTNPTGLSYSVTYNGSPTAPSAVGSYHVVATITDPSYTGTASGTLNIVAAPAPDLGVTINDGRQYVQYGKTLTYTIAVINAGNTVIANASVTDNLPPELDASTSSWTCFAAGTATCTSSGAGTNALSGNVQNLPIGGGVTYVLTATVRSDAAVPTEQVVNMVSVSASGDTNAANNSATSTTQIVIFRDGFEQGGDGAQATGVATPNQVGSLDATASLMLDPASAPQALNAPSTWLRATDAAGREAFRVDALRTANDVMVRVVSSDANGHESHSDWIALGAQTAALALADTSATSHALILLGTKNASLQVAIPAWATLPLGVYSAQ